MMRQEARCREGGILYGSLFDNAGRMDIIEENDYENPLAAEAYKPLRQFNLRVNKWRK
jgi:hypothetical protein